MIITRNLIRENRNEIDLVKLDACIYVFEPEYITIYKEDNIKNIMASFKKELECKTKLKVIYSKYEVVPSLDIEGAERLLSIFYLAEK